MERKGVRQTNRDRGGKGGREGGDGSEWEEVREGGGMQEQCEKQ